MAKKKNIKKSASKVSKKEESMKNKVEIKQPSSAKQEKLSRLVGSIFIGLGVLLVAFGIFSYIKYREEPLLDPEFESPLLENVTSVTNGDVIKIQGNAKGYDSVFIYVNDEKIAEAKVDDDSKFSYEYTVEKEGEYKIAVAGVKGFPSRKISPKSEIATSIVDRTAPSKEGVTLKYGPETNRNTFVLVGTVEPNATVEVKRGTDSFSALADKDGNFRIEGIKLEEGKNVYSVYIKDLAGNEVQLDEKVRVNYSPLGSVNGDAVVDENIPQAAGTFDELIGNNLMMVFGLLALLAFVISSSVVYLKNKR